jgi:uncharacterized protein with PIN domain
VKLLLDEHYSPAIARQLRILGHDVVAVAERADLVSLSDDGLLFTSDKSMPRRSDAIGRVVDALDSFLQSHQSEGSYRNQVQRLSA